MRFIYNILFYSKQFTIFVLDKCKSLNRYSGEINKVSPVEVKKLDVLIKYVIK